MATQTTVKANNQINDDSQSTKIQEIGRLLDSLPLGKFFYVLSIGYVFHMRTFYPWMCPSILLKAVHYTTGFK